jgi:hypothetical protein
MKKSKIALIAAGLIAGATLMGCGGNNDGIPDITGGGEIEQPNPDDLKLPEGFEPLSLNIEENYVNASFAGYIPNTLAAQATVLKTRPLLSENIINIETSLTAVANISNGVYLGKSRANLYENIATELGTMLGNDASALLDAYRNAKYLEKRENNDNNILEGIKEASGENDGNIKQLVEKLYDKLLSIIKDDETKVSRENKLALLTQVGDFAAFTGWVNMLLEKGIHPSFDDKMNSWDGNYLGVPVPSIVKQNATTIEAGAGQ